MVVGDFYIGRLPVIPPENQTPLLIDSQTPKALEIAGKGFESIAWWNSQICKEIGRMKLPELEKSPILNFTRQFL